MTKRTVLYVFSAVLLGIVTMITPLWLSWASQVTVSPEEKPEDFVELFCESGQSTRKWEDILGRDSYQVGHEPTASYEGVGIFAVGFFLALTVRFIVKRRIPYSHYRFPPV